MSRFVMQAHELFCFQGDHRVRSAIFIGELNFVNTGSPALDHSAYLAPDQAVFGQVFKQRNDRK
jgi:hypothetical protein